nr:hypothetical protein [Candidatus Paceibacterota bacterium]
MSDNQPVIKEQEILLREVPLGSNPKKSTGKFRRPPSNRQSSVRPVTHYDAQNIGKRETDHIPDLKDGDIRIIHLGGVEEIGRNMSLVEYK